MMSGHHVCLQAHAVIKMYPMYELRWGAGKLTRSQSPYRDTMLLAIAPNAAQLFLLAELQLKQAYPPYRAIGSVTSTLTR
jgi:hypothetical protein